MIRQIIRLTRPGVFLPCFEAAAPEKCVLVRPRHLSICAADQRYFSGDRPRDVLRRKLPMALIHEATGIVLQDPGGAFRRGQPVVLLPGGAEPPDAGANYRTGAFFRSSNADGFSQEMLYLSPEECIPINGDYSRLYVFTELLSVCCHAWRRARPNAAPGGRGYAGVWGDGPMGYMMALALRHLEPGLHLTVYGKHDDKLMMFSFADERINVLDRLEPLSLDCAFECVGGSGAEPALRQIADCLKPCGHVTMMGVSEKNPALNTRLILEKGLRLMGCSRSSRRDFIQAGNLIELPELREALEKIVSDEIRVSDYISLGDSFINDRETPYKTVISWNV